jgi:hypothetical protein
MAIYAVSVRILGVGPMGFCFGPGARYRGVRAIWARTPDTHRTLNLFLVSISLTCWESDRNSRFARSHDHG